VVRVASFLFFFEVVPVPPLADTPLSSSLRVDMAFRRERRRRNGV
jgi:hypothetical protein